MIFIKHSLKSQIYGEIIMKKPADKLLVQFTFGVDAWITDFVVYRWIKFLQYSDGTAIIDFINYELDENNGRLITIQLNAIPDDPDVVNTYKNDLALFQAQYELKSKIIAEFKEITTIDDAFERILIENLSGQSLNSLLEYLKLELSN